VYASPVVMGIGRFSCMRVCITCVSSYGKILSQFPTIAGSRDSLFAE